jgi:NAD(P)-dependent dehydrogenase (short-subunit alcohol dehydrogenase family)
MAANLKSVKKSAVRKRVSKLEWQIRVDLAAAYQLAHIYEWTDLIHTHFSARVPGPEDFLINAYGLMFDEITASNPVKIDPHGKVVPPLERRAEAGEKDTGVIVNVSSDAGRKGTIGQINYGAAKAGVLGLTMSAAREWGRYGIRVNGVACGIVSTEMTEVVRGEKFRDKYLASIPLGRFVEPDEAVKAIAFLASPASRFITGQHFVGERRPTHHRLSLSSRALHCFRACCYALRCCAARRFYPLGTRARRSVGAAARI